MKKKIIIFGLISIFIAVFAVIIAQPSDEDGESAFIESESIPGYKQGVQEKKPEKKKEIIVYITRTGKKYHKGICRYLKKSKIRITPQEACARGYTP